MKKQIVLVLCISLAMALSGQTFTPFRKLLELETKYFLFIYPEESQRTALILADKADAVYEDLAQKFGHDFGARIPVVITPDTGVMNAMYSPMPYPKIVIYDAPLDLEWTSFAENITGVFLHELVHLVSLNVRPLVLDFFYGLFGGWVVPGYINTPLFMVEGATVSFESLGGFGRTNEPLVRQRLRQDSFENKFMTPVQVSGVFDKYPYGKTYYEYGGLFSRFLQEKFGMEKYRDLWNEMGSGLYLSFDWRESFFQGCFKKVYGIPLEEVWASFRLFYTLAGVAENPNVVGLEQYDIRFMSAFGDGVAFVDAFSGKILKLKKGDDSAGVLFDSGGDTGSFDIASDGKTYLLSRFSVTGSLIRYYSEIRDTETGIVSLAAGDVSGAKFFRDGFAGIRGNIHNGDLVLCSRDGIETVLRGTETFMVSDPEPLDENRIALIASENGIRFLGIFDVNEKILYRITFDGDEDPFRYARNLSSLNGRLFFSFNDDDTFFRLGSLEADSVRLDSGLFSGGLLNPVEIQDGKIWYEGRFSAGSRVMEYPNPPEAVGTLPGGRILKYTLVPYDTAPGAAVLENRIDQTKLAFPERPFGVLPWYNPARLWFPYPVMPSGSGIIPEGFGVYSWMSDPAEDVSLKADLSWRYPFLFCSAILETEIFFPALTVSASAIDKLSYSGTSVALDRRVSGGSLFLDALVNLVPASNAILFGLGGTAEMFSDSHSQNPGEPYLWNFSGVRTFLTGSFGFSSLAYYGNGRRFVRGLKVLSIFDLNPLTLEWKAEGSLNAAAEGLPFLLSAYAGWSPDPLFTFSGYSFALPERHRTLSEYGGETWTGNWIGGGELAVQFLLADVQNEISHVYFNFLEGRAGWRGAAIGSGSNVEFRHSVFLTAFAAVSPVAGMMSTIQFQPYVEGALKVNGLYDGFLDGADWAVRFGLRTWIF